MSTFVSADLAAIVRRLRLQESVINDCLRRATAAGATAEVTICNNLLAAITALNTDGNTGGE